MKELFTRQILYCLLLSVTILYFGFGHLTFLQKDLAESVFYWMPFYSKAILYIYSIVEISLGLALLIFDKSYRKICRVIFIFYFITLLVIANNIVNDLSNFQFSLDINSNHKVILYSIVISLLVVSFFSWKKNKS